VRIRRWAISTLLAVPGVLVLTILIYTLIARSSASGAETFAKSDASLAKEFANTDATQKLLQESDSFMELPKGFTPITRAITTTSQESLTVLAMFLIGLYLGRSNFIRQLPEKIEYPQKSSLLGSDLLDSL
jgi:uncharacterized protein